MKKRKGIFFGFTVALAAVMFNFASCDNSTTVVNDVFGIDQFPDIFTHATSPGSKVILQGDALMRAKEFLWDTSHYFFIERSIPGGFQPGNFDIQIQAPTPVKRWQFDPAWVSAVNDRVYRGPFFDPLTRSVNWLSINPNGSINNSVGSYWSIMPPGFAPEFQYNELQGFIPSNRWKISTAMAPGQSTQNYIQRRRGTFAIDAALLHLYSGDGVTFPAGWENRNELYVEVRLVNYALRVITPANFYDGHLPTTAMGAVMPLWRGLPGWGTDAVNDATIAAPVGLERAAVGPARDVNQFWNVATGAGTGIGSAHWNLRGDDERAIYLARANADPSIIPTALTGRMVDLHFEIMQIVHVIAQNGFDYELYLKINGIDRNRDGWLDRHPYPWPVPATFPANEAEWTPAQQQQAGIGRALAGRVILQNEERSLIPYWVFYEMNFFDMWWFPGFRNGHPIRVRQDVDITQRPLPEDWWELVEVPAWYTAGAPIVLQPGVMPTADGFRPVTQPLASQLGTLGQTIRRGTPPTLEEQLARPAPAHRPRPAPFSQWPRN